LIGEDPVAREFEHAFPLRCAEGASLSSIFTLLQSGVACKRVEAAVHTRGGDHLDLVFNASPLRGADGGVIGSVFTINDVSETLRLLAREQAARGEAERANRVKDEFLATLSHELRTPINAILGWAQLLHGSSPSADEVERAMEVIERNAKMQAQLISDLLDMSRILSGSLVLERKLVDFREVVQAAIDSVVPAAEAKDIKIRKELPPAFTGIVGDPRRLQQIVWNLLTNAVKFTPVGGEVRVAIQQIGTNAQLCVTDTGQGIAPDFIDHVFERFRQGDSATTRKATGLGLGLAIVKQLTELHGGTVEAHSEGEDSGATFTITLPFAAGETKSVVIERARNFQDAVRQRTLTGVDVLMVDDDMDARDVAKRALEACGARVITTGEVTAALDLFLQFKPAVLISDISMPEIDGHELIRRIRSRPDGREVIAIALSAMARPDDATRSLRAGFQAHLTKPIDIVDLESIVSQMRRSAAGQQNKERQQYRGDGIAAEG
jgi:signal transduction histidine kinase/CheY-like chemotaxis protein